VDVTGLTFAAVMDIPGNVLAGNWRAMVYMDDKSTPQQEEALLNLYTGKLGGPVADLVKLIGEVVGMERVPITFNLEGVSSLGAQQKLNWWPTREPRVMNRPFTTPSSAPCQARPRLWGRLRRTGQMSPL
jgi:hypothetical protein